MLLRYDWLLLTSSTIISLPKFQIPKNTTEFDVAARAFESRHPAINRWDAAHNFFLCKLEIQQITVLDYYGGPHFVTVDEYYDANFDAESAPAPDKDYEYEDEPELNKA